MGASILDVAPTILAAFGEPIPLGMDGAVLVQAFEPTWLEKHAPRYADVDTRWLHLPESEVPREPVDETLLEDLRTLGYLP